MQVHKSHIFYLIVSPNNLNNIIKQILYPDPTCDGPSIPRPLNTPWLFSVACQCVIVNVCRNQRLTRTLLRLILTPRRCSSYSWVLTMH